MGVSTADLGGGLEQPFRAPGGSFVKQEQSLRLSLSDFGADEGLEGYGHEEVVRTPDDPIAGLLNKDEEIATTKEKDY